MSQLLPVVLEKSFKDLLDILLFYETEAIFDGGSVYLNKFGKFYLDQNIVVGFIPFSGPREEAVSLVILVVLQTAAIPR